MAVSRFITVAAVVLLMSGVSSGAFAYDAEYCNRVMGNEDYQALVHVPKRELGFFEKSELAVLLRCRAEAQAFYAEKDRLEEVARTEAAEAARAAAARQRAKGIGPREIPLCVGNCR